MRSRLRFVILCFVCLFFCSDGSAAFSLREGNHEGYTRIVFDMPKGSQLISSSLSHPRVLELRLQGPVCQDFAAHSRVSSKVIRFWKSTKAKKKQCRVSFSLYKNSSLNRAFVLDKSGKSPLRLVVDLGAEGQVVTQPKVLPKPKPQPKVAPKPQVNIAPQPKAMPILPAEKPKLPLPKEPTPQKTFPEIEVKIKPEVPLNKTVDVIKENAPQRPVSLDVIEPPEKPTTYLFHPRLVSKPFRPTIVIDAGHGGKDPGSISCRGHYEKHVTLKASRVLATELKKSGRYHVVLTRTRDVFVPKRKRFAIAREAKADFLISVHADNHPSKDLRGLTIYTLSPKASDKEAERLSKLENKSDFLTDLDFTANTSRDVSNVLIDIAQRSSKNTALSLAEALHVSLSEDKVGKLMTMRSADLAVLKAPDTPSILVELGYLSNEKDEKLVRSVQYQKKLAQSLVKALDKHFEKV